MIVVSFPADPEQGKKMPTQEDKNGHAKDKSAHNSNTNLSFRIKIVSLVE